MDRRWSVVREYDNAENLYRSGEARLKQIKAEFNVSTNQAQLCRHCVPQERVVVKTCRRSRALMAAGQTVFTLAAPMASVVLISLPEQAQGRFKVGQAVSVELWTRRINVLPGTSANCRQPPIQIPHLCRSHCFHGRQGPAELG